MIRETGRVVAVETDAVWVETIRRGSCQSCAVQKACGHGLLASAGLDRQQHVRVLLGAFKPSEIEINDQVEISVPESLLVSGTFLVYLVPLLVLLAGAFLASEWLPRTGMSADLSALLGATLGFALGLSVVKIHGVTHRDDVTMQPTLAAIVGHAVPVIAATEASAEHPLR